MTKGWMQVVISESLGKPTYKDYLNQKVSLEEYEKQNLNYPESLDACREFEDRLDEDEVFNYSDYLYHELKLDLHLSRIVANFKMATAKPEQRCIAYLKTKGLWND